MSVVVVVAAAAATLGADRTNAAAMEARAGLLVTVGAAPVAQVRSACPVAGTRVGVVVASCLRVVSDRTMVRSDHVDRSVNLKGDRCLPLPVKIR